MAVCEPPPQSWCAANCAAWSQPREDKCKGDGCGAMVLDRARGCVNLEWAKSVRENVHR